MKQTLFIGAVASVLTLNAFAETTTSTIPTQSYVDTNFQTKIPAKQSSWADTVITSTNTAGTVGQRSIYDYAYSLYDDTLDYDSNAGQYLTAMNTLQTALQYITDAQKAGSLPENTDKAIPVFSASSSDTFNKVITTNTLDYQGTWGSGNVIPTLTAVSSGMATKQDKMTCAQYIENAEQTSANCLLWNVPD